MAEKIDTMTDVNAPAIAETPIATKKPRKPRAKKAALETAPADVAAEPVVVPAVAAAAAEKPKRGRKTKAIAETVATKRAPVKAAPKTVKKAPASPAKASDDMADLLQLEEENQKLRKLLSEKLRAENADLRKRLKID